MEINSQNREKKMDAVKKVIANMTVGKDVSSLFTDVINCIQVSFCCSLVDVYVV
jgi:AP-1 complex subunit beta-1